MKNLILIAVTIFFFSCQKTEVPNASSPEYMTWTEGDWWAHEWATYDYNTGDTTVRSIDTTYALADTMINGQLYRALSRGIYPWNNEPLFLRDSFGFVVDLYGTVIYNHENFTDTLFVDSVPQLGVSWYSKMVHDADQTIVPAGSFTTINYQTVAVNSMMPYPCGLTQMVSDRQFADGVGLVRMSYHYSAPGPCVDNVRVLVDYYQQ